MFFRDWEKNIVGVVDYLMKNKDANPECNCQSSGDAKMNNCRSVTVSRNISFARFLPRNAIVSNCFSQAHTSFSHLLDCKPLIKQKFHSLVLFFIVAN